MKNNNYVDIILHAWKTKIEVMEVKITDIDNDIYCEVLTRLFNNQREYRKSILEINNYYNSNDIILLINLDNYIENSHNTREDNIEHLIEWTKSMCNYQAEISYEIKQGYLYEIDEYKSNINYFDNKDNFYYNFIRGEE